MRSASCSGRRARATSIRSAREEIVATLPESVTAVGVFVDQPADEVNEIAESVGLGAVQLHGDEMPGLRARDEAAGDEGGRGRRSARRRTSTPGRRASAFCWTCTIRSKKGGTGQDRRLVGRGQRSRSAADRAGGRADAENVGDAIARVRPFGIDVSSGVEADPGIKDHGRIKALFEAVHGSHYAARS